ncbi:MAG: universal stress protein [Fimbriimonadaceae bacterium]|nr:MAG: Stress response protein NhaX [Armatimonadetes bacterium OLB18]WKZ80579.1 MAG: universal stress protein [Fimbriimonadaceae bacterium]
MVRIVAGIDDHHENALSFLDRLRFASADVRLLYVIESLMPDKSFPDLGPNHPLSVLMAEIEQQSEAKLAAAAAMLAPTGYPVQTELRKGDSARCLIEFASSWPADIIAVGSAQKGQWGSLFFGSVTKALTAGAEQSILIAKSPPRDQAGVSAVLATDHSPYCDACIERFFSWEANGVRRMTVLTSLDRGTAPQQVGPAEASERLTGSLPDVKDQLRARNEELCLRFRSEGIECESVLVEDHPQSAIAQTMSDTEADLLLLGARGHGFWDRIRLGSVSHYQVVATPHNVLVIRV